MPEYNASIATQFWLSLALPHSEYGAASMVGACITDFERTQANVGKAFINLWPGDSVAHSRRPDGTGTVAYRDSTQNVLFTKILMHSVTL